MAILVGNQGQSNSGQTSACWSYGGVCSVGRCGGRPNEQNCSGVQVAGQHSASYFSLFALWQIEVHIRQEKTQKPAQNLKVNVDTSHGTQVVVRTGSNGKAKFSINTVARTNTLTITVSLCFSFYAKTYNKQLSITFKKTTKSPVAFRRNTKMTDYQHLKQACHSEINQYIFTLLNTCENEKKMSLFLLVAFMLHTVVQHPETR